LVICKEKLSINFEQIKQQLNNPIKKAMITQGLSIFVNGELFAIGTTYRKSTTSTPGNFLASNVNIASFTATSGLNLVTL